MLRSFLVWALSASIAAAVCFDATPAFPVPQWHGDDGERLTASLRALQTTLDHFAAEERYDASSFSVELTSPTSSFWSYHHTARKRNETRPGVEKVDGDSLYRIASITKIFTVLGLLYQHEEGHLSLDSPISDYIPELSGPHAGKLPWKDITLRTLASQLSGIPRDFAQGDLLDYLPNPVEIGLPPVEPEGLPSCDEYAGYISACNASALIEWLKKAQPLFAPNQKSTYSNLNYELIGLALEKATNMSYKEYMGSAIFDPLEMGLTTIDKPPDTYAVLPLGPNYWDVDEGVQNPTGGIYSSSSDMSKLLRYILTHYNAIATGVNWLMPASWSGGVNSFYGMPWEIFRSDKVFEDSPRPVTFATKGGGLPGYVSKITLLHEYNLGVTILVGFQDYGGELLEKLQDTVTIGLARAAEAVVWDKIEQTYAGTYTPLDRSLNSTIELASTPSTGLILNTFVSNSTDVLATVAPKYFVDPTREWRVQLMPTMLYKDEEQQQGEIWRFQPVYERKRDAPIWDEFCITDVDGPMYAGRQLLEVVFWHEEGVLELPAWRVKMKKPISASGGDLLKQDLGAIR